jgi:hypothetical protein
MHTDYLIRNSRGTVPGISFESPRFGPALLQQAGGYAPADLHKAYNIPTTGGTGAIAIVDAFDFASALTDFNFFANTYGLPTEPSGTVTASTNKVFQVVYAGGTEPASGVANGWCGEEALDMEWVHAMAPNCKVYLVEANSNANSDLNAAIAVAAALPNVKEVSMSFGGGEDPSELQDTTFQGYNGVVFFASTGDDSVQEYPSESPYVVGVGGTSLTVTSTGYGSEAGWAGSGGGPSAFEPRPAFQNPVASVVGSVRGAPDVSAVADPETGVNVYSTTAFGTGNADWQIIGGTSLACPITAAMTNQRGSWTHDDTRELERIYFNLGGQYYHDVVFGGTPLESCTTGWDFVTGIGSPKGLFPAYIPPETLASTHASIYQNGTSTISNQTTIQQTLKLIDGVTWNVSSIRGVLGQTADELLTFKMDKPLSSLTAATVNVDGNAPLGVTLQVFAYDYFPTDHNGYVLMSNTAATGVYANLPLTLSSHYIQPGTGNVSLVVRAIRPFHISQASFTYSVDSVTLQEATVQPWDVNLPL